jgi:peptide/nickel transport system substrate-binding protein
VAFEARYVASLLESLGYRASVKTFPASKVFEYFTKILDSRTRAQAGYLGWVADYPSSLAFFREEISCSAFVPRNPGLNSNVSEFCDPAIDAEIRHAAAVQVEDPPAAVALYRKVERAILEQAPMVPTYNGRSVSFLARRVGDYAYNPQWGVLLDQLWVK